MVAVQKLKFAVLLVCFLNKKSCQILASRLDKTGHHPGGGGTLHKFGQGCLFEDVFTPPPKITGFKCQPPKNNRPHTLTPIK